MNKKFFKYSHIFLLTVLTLSIGACKKDSFLDVPNKGNLSDVTTFSSEGNADLFINDIYLSEPNMKARDQYNHIEDYSDNSNVCAAWMPGQNTVRNGSISANNVPTGMDGMWNWGTTYGRIRKCNVFLQQAAKYKSNFSAAWYTKRVAEVTFMRAFFYSLLYTAYAVNNGTVNLGLPIIKVPLDRNTQGDEIFQPRATADETLAFIEADCDAAAAVLPLKQGASDLGRPTKGAALTLKGWVQLWAASPLFNKANDINKWAKAAATNKAVMDLGIYSLFTIPGDTLGFSKQFLGDNNFNSETIFARGYDGTRTNGGVYEGHMGPVYVKSTQQGYGGFQPTQSLVDDFYMKNGLPITDPNSGYDPQNPYANRETRFYQTIIYDGSPWQGDILYMRNTPTANNRIDLGSSSDITNTGYYGKKVLDESILAQTSIALTPSKANYIWYRYAEVLLSYAEAQNEASGPDGSVYAALNQIHKRALLPDVPAGMSQSQMRTYIRRERRVELALEDKRWFDIRRWNITAGPTGVLNTPFYGMLITEDPATKNLTYKPVNVYNNRFFEWQNIMPIPQSVIESNPKLVQNPLQ
jgi:starch-binding outer membrane protein, SusD/RagB family